MGGYFKISLKDGVKMMSLGQNKSFLWKIKKKKETMWISKHYAPKQIGFNSKKRKLVKTDLRIVYGVLKQSSPGTRIDHRVMWPKAEPIAAGQKARRKACWVCMVRVLLCTRLIDHC